MALSDCKSASNTDRAAAALRSADAGHAAYLATRHFGCLDGVRFLSISAVIWHHAPIWEGMRDVSVFFARGHVGVDFFFVLSGFLITTLLLREEAAQGAFSLRAFYWRRALRIIPIYFLVVSVAAFYAIVIKGRTGDLEILPYYFFFLSNFLKVEDIGFLAPTWSLSVEEQYYLIWPALLLLVPRRWMLRVLLGLIALNVLGGMGVYERLGLLPIEGQHLRFELRGTTYAPILMGSLCALLLHHRGGYAALRPLAGFRAAPWLWFVLLLVALAGFPGALEGLPNLVVHTLMCLTVVSLVFREDNAMAPLMRLPPVVRIGQISYGIYLYHLFALVLVTKLFGALGIAGQGWVLPAYYLLAVVMAEVSFRTFEAWFMGFRKSGPGRVAADPVGQASR